MFFTTKVTIIIGNMVSFSYVAAALNKQTNQSVN